MVLKIAFIPISIATGLLGGLVGKKIFDQIWGLIDDEEPPEQEHRDVPWWKVIVALALQGAIFRVMRGVVDRGARIAFANATGTWPGEEKPEEE